MRIKPPAVSADCDFKSVNE